MYTPLTDPAQHLFVTSLRNSGLAHSARPDAPVLPVVEPRSARTARALRNATRRLAGRPRPAVARRPASAATCG